MKNSSHSTAGTLWALSLIRAIYLRFLIFSVFFLINASCLRSCARGQSCDCAHPAGVSGGGGGGFFMMRVFKFVVFFGGSSSLSCFPCACPCRFSLCTFCCFFMNLLCQSCHSVVIPICVFPCFLVRRIFCCMLYSVLICSGFALFCLVVPSREFVLFPKWVSFAISSVFVFCCFSKLFWVSCSNFLFI